VKVAFIGAGSQKFVRGSVADMLTFPALRNSTVSLMDINQERLDISRRLIERMVRQENAAVTVEATTDQRRALEGADFVISTVMIGGMKHYESDTYIPAKYGISVASGDTIGPGAVFRLVRTVPFLRELVTNVASVCPDAWILSYVNPMAMVTNAMIRLGHRRSVGFCHAAQLAVRDVGRWLEIDHNDIEFTVGGINHLNFFLSLTHKGEDLYPRFKARADWIAEHAEIWDAETWSHQKQGYELVRMEVLKYLGYFPLEGPWHQGEYYPWFRKNAQLVKRYGPDTGWAIAFDKKLLAHDLEEMDGYLSGARPIPVERSLEYGVPFMHSLSTGEQRLMHLNVLNEGCIDVLPPRSVVEVACQVGRGGVAPGRVDHIPVQLAGIMHQHTTVHELALQGALEGDRGTLRMALQADPLTGAVLTLPQIAALADELLKENEAFLR
jgi:alpha-galactosidase